MALLAKRLKWLLRDCWLLLTARSGKQEPKTVHLMLCRVCDGYHRVNIRRIGAELDELGMPPDEMMFPAGKHKCPRTGEVFYGAVDDWLHLTEREYDLLPNRK